MRDFACPHCGQRLAFENSVCLSCSNGVGFDLDLLDFVVVERDGTVAGDLPYSIEDVPWTMYFLGGYALHAAFWHDKFGTRRSHGCAAPEGCARHGPASLGVEERGTHNGARERSAR